MEKVVRYGQDEKCNDSCENFSDSTKVPDECKEAVDFSLVVKHAWVKQVSVPENCISIKIKTFSRVLLFNDITNTVKCSFNTELF